MSKLLDYNIHHHANAAECSIKAVVPKHYKRHYVVLERMALVLNSRTINTYDYRLLTSFKTTLGLVLVTVKCVMNQ